MCSTFRSAPISSTSRVSRVLGSDRKVGTTSGSFVQSDQHLKGVGRCENRLRGMIRAMDTYIRSLRDVSATALRDLAIRRSGSITTSLRGVKVVIHGSCSILSRANGLL